MCTPASSGARAFHGLPAGSREPTSPGIRGLSSQARASADPPLGERRAAPQVVTSVGRQPDRVARRRRRRWRAGRPPSAISTSSAAVGSSTCSAAAVALQVADAEPAAAQRRRRLGAPVVEQQLDPAYRLERRAGSHRGRPALVARPRWPASGTSSAGSRSSGPPRRAMPDLAGQHHRAAAAGHQQPPGEQLLGGRRGVLGQHGVPGRSVVASPPGQRRARAAPGPASESSASCAATAAGVGGLGELPAAARSRRRSGRRSAPRPRRSAAAARRGTPRPAPGRAAGRRAPATASGRRARSASGRRGGLACDDEGIEDGELEAGQLVERAQQRGPGRRPARPAGRSREGREWRGRDAR